MISVARVESRNIDMTRCKCNPEKNLISVTSIPFRTHEAHPVIPQCLVTIHAIERYQSQAMYDKLVRKHRGVHFDFHDVDGWMAPHI